MRRKSSPASPDGRIVAAREGNLLATSFHPELTADDRLHRYFVEQISSPPVGAHAAGAAERVGMTSVCVHSCGSMPGVRNTER